MKKWFVMILALALVSAGLLILPIEAQAATEYTEGIYTYTVTDGKATITKCDDSVSEKITIPSTLGGYPVTVIGNGAFYFKTNLTGVKIPEGVTSIEGFAFVDCVNLVDVIIPNSIVSIDMDAFDLRGKIVCNIYDNAKYLGNEQNPYLVLMETTTDNISSCRIHPDTKVIAELAFMESGLTDITIPAGIRSVNDYAFWNCPLLTSISVDKHNANYTTDSYGVLFNKNRTKLVAVPGGLSGSYVVPSGVSAICDGAFGFCTNLTSIEMPTSVSSIGTEVFYACDGLINMTIPKGVVSIGFNAFIQCKNLTNLTISNSVTKIWNQAFYGCSNLSNVIYCGTAGQWDQIDIGSNNDYLLDAQLMLTNHDWNAGTVVKRPTCKVEGTKTYTCTICKDTKTEAIDKLTTHTYDNDCDAVCNICNQSRTITHKYMSTWSKDQSSHWHECYVCKDKKDVSAHTPGAAATETTAQTCTACGYIIQPALGHTHNYAQKWTMDDSGHWHACDGCNEKKSESAHTPGKGPTETQAQTCTVCGYIIQPPLGHTHNYTEKWIMDENGHWHTCSGCNQIEDEAAHTPGSAATATTPQTCTVCGYEITPALGEITTEPTTPNVSMTVPPESSEVPSTSSNIPSGEDDGDTTWITIAAIVVAVCAVVVAAASAVVTVIYVKKKK